jgi:recombination protein RecT
MSNVPAQKQDMVMSMLQSNWKTIQNVLPKHLTPERIARIAYTAIANNPKLRECSSISLANAVITASQMGLEIGGPLGMAHLVPFKNEATLIIGYKGFMDLAYRSGIVSNFSAQPVYENDHFEYSYGLNPNLEHRPVNKDRGKLVYAYAVCHYTSGGYDFEVVNAADIADTKSMSAGARSGRKDCPWNDPKQEWTMWVKTAIRRLAKRIPQSPDIQRAAAIDERADAGVSQELTHIIEVQPTAVDDLNAKVMGDKAENMVHCPITNKDHPESSCIDCPESGTCPSLKK